MPFLSPDVWKRLQQYHAARNRGDLFVVCRQFLSGTWFDNLKERMANEVRFAQVYCQDFDHGTDGHIRLETINYLAGILDQVIDAINDTPADEHLDLRVGASGIQVNRTKIGKVDS